MNTPMENHVSLKKDAFSVPEMADAALDVIEQLTSRLGASIGQGLGRVVFKSHHVVLKAPINDKGVMDNYREHRKWINRGTYGEVTLARCRLIHIRDIPVVVMTKVNTNLSLDSLPRWSQYVDCLQVGMDKQGVYRAYDYA